MACSRLALAALLLVASAALAAATKKTRCYLEPMATPVTIEAGDMGHLTFIAKGLKKASCSGMATLVATTESYVDPADLGCEPKGHFVWSNSYGAAGMCLVKFHCDVPYTAPGGKSYFTAKGNPCGAAHICVDVPNVPSPEEPMPSPGPTPTPVPSPVPTPTPIPSPVPSPEPIPSPEPTPTPVPSPEPTPTPVPSPEPTPTPVPSPTPKPEPTPIPVPSPEHSPEIPPTDDEIPPSDPDFPSWDEPDPSSSPGLTRESGQPDLIPSPLPSSMLPSPAWVPSPEPTPDPVPSPEPTPTPVPSPEPFPSPVPSPEPFPTPVPSPEPFPSPVPSPTPFPTPVPSPEPFPTPVPSPGPEDDDDDEYEEEEPLCPYPEGTYQSSCGDCAMDCYTKTLSCNCPCGPAKKAKGGKGGKGKGGYKAAPGGDCKRTIALRKCRSGAVGFDRKKSALVCLPKSAGYGSAGGYDTPGDLVTGYTSGGYTKGPKKGGYVAPAPEYDGVQGGSYSGGGGSATYSSVTPGGKKGGARGGQPAAKLSWKPKPKAAARSRSNRG